MNRYGANVSPCKIPVKNIKEICPPSGERTFTFVFFIVHHYGLRQFLWGDHWREVFAPFSLCV